ncbi:hypothetical protein S7711_09387 [Stachybotrys chartarum IBT 7711]|uniref:Nuclear pore complex protein Nup85 n=1 Tax=Stachybotrys chartarum (strain CBS 109288 / IBT 7711) TaxID=1280523 RepID=A0A084AIS9_STACB|nr:hypothetical protein S7711_09387 [Stachybotrys chartarum IBT 7711]
MAHRFIVPDSSPPSSPAPSTPEKKPHFGAGFSFMGENPSTTPAGPPPSSAASFTPAGAPSDSYLGSSIMRGVAGPKPLNFGRQSSGNTGQNFFGRSENSNAPLGRSIRGRGRQPSALSRQFSAGDVEEEDEDEEEEEEDEDAEGEDELPPPKGSLFRRSVARPEHEDGEDEDIEAEIERFIEKDLDAEGFEEEEEEEEEDGDEEEEDEAEEEEEDEAEEEEEDDEAAEDSAGASDDGDMFLNMRHDDRAFGQPVIGEETDLMLMSVAAADDRVRKEAESLFNRSTARLGASGRALDFQFSSIAKDIYTHQNPASITEPHELLLQTEDLISRLYDEGVGPEDDPAQLDDSLAECCARLVRLWNDYVSSLPDPEGEETVSVGPGLRAEPVEKASYVAHLVLRMHHTRFSNRGAVDRAPPLPEIMFDWQKASNELYPDQVRELSRFKPSPACHAMYWQTLRSALLQGDVSGAISLLRNAGWEHVLKGARGEKAYTGKALENVRHFANMTAEVLEQCPGARSDWDVWNSDWTLFRVQARGSLTRMTLFAEGKKVNLGDSMQSDWSNDEDAAQSLTAMARKASSQIPWDIYEHLQTVYGVVLGDHEAIMETAQDWCEATVGLLGWWDDGTQRNRTLKNSQSQNLLTSTMNLAGADDYFDRLASAFHLVLRSDLSPNPMNPVEVALACAFEDNINAVIGLLRMWSLPLASAVAEIASLGQWLPPTEPVAPFPTDTLDADDLALLGMTQPTQDDTEGIKDTTLVLYARQLAGIDHLSDSKDGWEMAIQVLGRMDMPKKSEETVGELLRDLLDTLDEKSGSTVNKMWRILNDLGMINFAEETAETYAEILSKESHRFGEALWYFALSHRADKVREVLNLLISYSLVQSAAYPAEKDLDQELKNLLRDRTATLEKCAKQDLEAAQLLGRMLSGYATLRKFYEFRDSEKLETLPTSKLLALKKQAAVALVAVISSADDNIRGGLYDESRDAVVSEDFILALLGEATVFINQSPAVITLDQIDVLMKAIEDIQTVGTRVYSVCDDFFGLVLSSGQGLKGSTPADLMTKSTNSLSGSSYMMTGSSMLASHLQRSMSSSGKIHRGWDWRKGWTSNTKGEDVVRKLRLGLAKDLATLWLEDADGVALY